MLETISIILLSSFIIYTFFSMSNEYITKDTHGHEL